VRYQTADGAWVNSIELTHVLSPLALTAWQLHQNETGAVTIEVHGQTDLEAVESAVRSLLGAVPVKASPANLARDAKPQRYSSTLTGALLV
jgi:phenylacetate-CoA ligase